MTLEKHASCSRCTSWTHKKDSCKSQPISCREEIDGTLCGKDHSRLVCQSGIPYCTSLSVKAVSSSNGGASNIDEDMPTVPYLQDLVVQCNGSGFIARTYWDTGSNRVLINNDFAKESGLRPRPARVIMKVAGGGKERLDVNTYELSLVDRSGRKHVIWGYGVDTILDPDEPVDASSLRHLFPHVPSEVFTKLRKRRVDILVGLIYNGLFPTGGSGKDCVGNLRVNRTRFGSTGWILGGAHKGLRCPDMKLSSVALHLCEIGSCS